MVTLTDIREWNKNLANVLPKSPVAVFTGATKGIGQFTLRSFVQHTANLSPRIYFVGRSKSIGEALVKEFEAINPSGTFIFLPTDLGLMTAVDQTCKTIIDRESTNGVNLLFMSQAVVSFKKETTEGLKLAYAVIHLSRLRVAQNLLPLIQRAQSLRRVVSVFTATKEGPIFEEDWQCEKVGKGALRGHAASMMTLALEELAKGAPTVSFVHNFPGFVNTTLFESGDGIMFKVMSTLGKFIGPYICMSDEECGERHVFIATTDRFPAKQADSKQSHKHGVAKGTDGIIGSGVYSVDEHTEPLEDPRQAAILDGHRKDGKMAAMHEFERATLQRICG